jgi:hypothetical protein
MECLSCGNCRQGESMYYCPARDEFIIDESYTRIRERVKSSWKKGDPNYESRRKKVRREQKTG